MVRIIATTFFVAMLAACQTPYQEPGFRGGVVAQPVTADTWRISARGNAYTGDTTIQDYVLLKAAETALAAGSTHFVIAGSSDASRTGAFTTPGSAQTTLIGDTAYTTWTPSSTHTFIKPGSDVLVRLIPKGTPPPPGAIDANEVVQFIGPRVSRG